MSDPAVPILLSGAIVIGDATRKERAWPKNGAKSLAATLVLAGLFSLLGNIPKSKGVVSALAWLMFVGVLFTLPLFKVESKTVRGKSVSVPVPQVKRVKG